MVQAWDWLVGWLFDDQGTPYVASESQRVNRSYIYDMQAKHLYGRGLQPNITSDFNLRIQISLI